MWISKYKKDEKKIMLKRVANEAINNLGSIAGLQFFLSGKKMK